MGAIQKLYCLIKALYGADFNIAEQSGFIGRFCGYNQAALAQFASQ